jgi:hypothetical protein
MESSQHHSPQNMIFQDSKEVPYRMAKMSEYSLLSNDSSTMGNSSSEPGPSFLFSPLERVKQVMRQFNLSQGIVASGRLLGSLNALLSQTNISFSSVASNISSLASSLSHTGNLTEIIKSETSQLLFFPIHSFLSYSKEAYDQHHNLSFPSLNSSTLSSFSKHPLVNDLFSKVSNFSQSMNDSLPLVVEVTKEFANKTKEVLSVINEEYLPEVKIIWPWEKKMKRQQELKRKSMEERETAETLDDLFHSENDDEYEKDAHRADEESSLKDKSSLESPSSSSSVFQQLLTLFQKFGSSGDHNSNSSLVSTDQAKLLVGNDSPNNKSVNVTGSTAIDGVNASTVVGDTEESKEESSVFYRFLRLFPSASEVFHGTSNRSRSSHTTHTLNTTDRHIELQPSNTQALRQLAEPSHLTKVEVSEIGDNKVANTAGEAEEESFLSFLLSSLTNSTNLSSLFWSSSENISTIDANSLFVNSSYHHLSSFTSYPLFLAIQTSLQVKTTSQYHEYMNVIGIQPLFDAILLLKKNKQYNNENSKKQGKENSDDVVLSSSSLTTSSSSPSAHLEINSYEAIKGLIHLLSFDMNIANQIIENKDIIEVLCNEIAKIVNEESSNSFLKKLKLSSSPTSTVLKEKEKQFQNLYNILSLFYEMIRLVPEDHCYLLQSNHKLTKALKILRENPVFSTFPVVSPPQNHNNNSSSGSTVNVTVISKKEDLKEVKRDDDYSSFSFMIDSSQPLKMNQISNILHCGLGNTEWKPRVPGQKGIRILALDGGGTRGVVSLTYIKEIMKRIKRSPSSVSTASSSSSIFSFLSSTSSSSSSSTKSKQDSSDPSNDDDTSSDEVRPYELFDMICGTSTGGIIALLLSGYSSTITISQCELLYDRFIKDIFSKKSSFNLLKKKAFYDETLFENILNSLCGNSIFLDINKNLLAPRVFCLSTKCNVIPPSPQIWRNYNYPMIQEGEERKKSRNPGSSRISLSTAIRATTAAPTFFTPVPYENGLYCDGALVANNPAAIAIEEAKVRKLLVVFFFYSCCLGCFLVSFRSYFILMFQLS